MGNRSIGWASLFGVLLYLGDQGGAGAQVPSDVASPVPQTIYRLQGPDSPESSSEIPSPLEPVFSDPSDRSTADPPTDPSTPIQQTDPQATLTREPQSPEGEPSAQPDQAPSTDLLTESAPIFQLDLRLQGESTIPSQGSGPSGAGLPGRSSDGSEAGTGGVPGIFGAPGGVSGPSTSGSGTQGSGLSTGSGPGSPGWGVNSSEAASAQRYPETTGLIVDARGLDFQPSMSMRLFDPEGNQVYTTPTANQELNTYLVASSGTAAYVSSEDQALSLVQRIGEKPLQIDAVKTLGYDLVISNEDAWELRQRNQVDKFLDNYAVVVIWEIAN